MAEFITTKGAAHYLEQIISGARERLVLISPFLKVSDVFLQRLQDAERRGVQTTVVYGKEELHAEERQRLACLGSIRLLYLVNLHAKCYFNEADMVITSMNMYEASEKNREMRIRLTAEEAAFGKAAEEADSIIAAATPRPLKQTASKVTEPARKDGPWSRLTDAERQSGSRGHCIRCRRGIFLNPSRPFCIDCYDVWAAFGNEDYEERFCHDCGSDGEASMRRPLCRSCFATSWSFR